VIAIGSDLDGTSTQNWAQPQPPKLLAVNVDVDDAIKNYRADVVLVGDAKVVTEALAHSVPDSSRLTAVASHLERLREQTWLRLDDEEPAATEFLRSVARALPDDAVVVCDMCIPGYWIAGFHPFPEPRKLLYPMGWGTLGFAFPAALGAALAHPHEERPALALCGDGGFLFAAGELATVAQEQLPLTTVIVDDGGYGMLRFDQDKAGEERFGVDLRTPDFEALARAFDLRAETVDDLDDAFGEALARHVADPEPSILVARAEALVPPPTTSPQWYRRP
jgi:acetolactate synthase-1/2/3 large subunit